MVDATQHEIGFDDMVSVFQQVDIEEVFDMNSGFFILHSDFSSKDSHGCRAGDLNRRIVLR